MASQALYRRYRSQTFGELIGQEHIVQTLRNALAEGRIAHAYLFTGPRGVGKTTVARLLAKAVNCTADQHARPCGECESCRSIAEGRAVDVIEMDAASHTSVDDAREIIERGLTVRQAEALARREKPRAGTSARGPATRSKESFVDADVAALERTGLGLRSRQGRDDSQGAGPVR